MHSDFSLKITESKRKEHYDIIISAEWSIDRDFLPCHLFRAC